MDLETFKKLLRHFWYDNRCTYCHEYLTDAEVAYDKQTDTIWCHPCYDAATARAEMVQDT